MPVSNCTMSRRIPGPAGNYGKKEVKQDNEIDNVAAGESAEQPADLSNAMAAYSAAISKTKDIKLSNK